MSLLLVLLLVHSFSLVSSASLRAIERNVPFLSPNDDVQHQGFLGCKYDADLCKDNEFCFDDHLFGQCWKSEGVRADQRRLKPNSELLAPRKFQALKYTFHVLKYLDLAWKDRATQCILSEILFSPKNQWFDRLHLKLMYKYCFNEQQFAVIRRRFQRLRRASTIIDQNHQFHYHLPYASYTRSAQFFTDLFVSVANPDKDNVADAMTEESSMNNPVPFASAPSKFHRSTLANLSGTVPSSFETTRGFIIINRGFANVDEANRLLTLIADANGWPLSIFVGATVDHQILTYDVIKDQNKIDVNDVINTIIEHQKPLEEQLELTIVDIGIGQPNSASQFAIDRRDGSRLTIITWVTCTLVVFFTSLIVSFYCIARNERVRFKLMDENPHRPDSSFCSPTYLCQSPVDELTMEKASHNPLMFAKEKIDIRDERDESSSSSTRNTSPNEDRSPVNMDISTGHLILSYMEDHLQHRELLAMEWQTLCLDARKDEHTAAISVALSELNLKKNRSADCIPYDHARIQLVEADDDNSDYINASPISDSSPKCKYIATQGPMPNTTNAFWQMVWEQGSCAIVALARPIENGQTMYHHYWPIDGTKQFGDFEVNLVSEHSWSADYLVRSFYLKNIQTMETRTVTQFHFFTWQEFGSVPSSQALLDFRRKVNKSFHGRAAPIIVHCNDGCGRTGSYILIDMVLNSICKGTREINIAATLEHLRDQRAQMVKTKEQFEFVFAAVAEEVHQLLQAISE